MSAGKGRLHTDSDRPTSCRAELGSDVRAANVAPELHLRAEAWINFSSGVGPQSRALASEVQADQRVSLRWLARPQIAHLDRWAAAASATAGGARIGRADTRFSSNRTPART